MVIVGLTGGVASGKSFVAQCFVELGADLIDADQVAHEVLQDQETVDRIVEVWGNGILDEKGDINRKQLGKIVFGGPDESNLNLLESITHPKIRSRIRNRLEQLKAKSGNSVVVLDIPLLFEGNYDQECDHLVFVDTEKSVRQHRAKIRGWDEDELDKRESKQLSVEDKKLQSDFVIDNSGTKESTARQLSKFWESLKLEIPLTFRNQYLKTGNE
jgi:dephospho-CoA kinase